MPTREEQIQLNTNLHQSIIDDKEEDFNAALEDGAEIESRDGEGLTALAKAARFGRNDYVEALMGKNSDIEAVDKNGNTPLILAAVSGDIDSIESLLKAGANPLHKNVENGVFLAYIPEDSISEAKKGKLTKIYEKTATKANELFEAAKSGNQEDFNKALKEGAKIQATTDPNGTNLTSYAAAGGNLDILKKVVEQGVSIHQPDNNGCTALSNAAACGKLDIVKYLIEKGADIGHTNTAGKTVAYLASDSAMQVNANSLKLDTEELSDDKIEEAIEEALIQYQEVSNTLVATNAANQKMIRAARSGNIESFQAAVKSAQPSAQFDGKNPLLIAAENGHTEMLKVIAEALPETLKGTDKNGCNAALSAAAHGNVETFAKLVELGVDPHGTNKEGSNAACLAAHGGHMEMLEHLVTNHPVNDQGNHILTQEDDRGNAAPRFAQWHKDNEVAALKKAGKKTSIKTGTKALDYITGIVVEVENAQKQEQEEELEGFETPRDKPSSRPNTPDNSAEKLSGQGQGRGQGD